MPILPIWCVSSFSILSLVSLRGVVVEEEGLSWQCLMCGIPVLARMFVCEREREREGGRERDCVCVCVCFSLRVSRDTLGARDAHGADIVAHPQHAHTTG